MTTYIFLAILVRLDYPYFIFAHSYLELQAGSLRVLIQLFQFEFFIIFLSNFMLKSSIFF